MTELTFVRTPAGVAPGNGYSHVVWGTGRFVAVAVAGQVALDEDGDLVGAGRRTRPGPTGVRQAAGSK